jgi:DNA polymerase III alpha subunit
MSKKIQFNCGCFFDYNEKDKSIVFDYNIENINLDCEKTWNLIGEGNTKGVFQLESRLGSTIAKQLKPENIEQLSALISIIRPGALDAVRDGKNVTNHYVDKKNGLESIDYFHPALEPSLKTTLGEMIYQEQAMQIAKDIAGFDLKEADNLRKTIGKKLADKMAAMKSKFLEGCKAKNIVNEKEAEQIFSWIEKGQRYSFNKSILDDTLVMSESGQKTIKELQIGEKILAPSENGDHYVAVLNKYDHGDQEVFKITLSNGNSIVCTMEHKFLCSDNNIYPLSEILLNDLEIMCITAPQQIARIQKIGIRPTVDIEVESSSHIFYGNGIATSNSHGVSYAINAYLSAYVKAHFPKEFFASYLKFAKNKVKPQDEIKALIQNAREMDTDVLSPDIRKLNEEFILLDNKIYFGLTDVKGVGASVFSKLQKIIEEDNIDIQNIDWINCLYKILVNINSTASKALIEAGALDFTKKSRNSMLYEYELASQLTAKELQFIKNNISSSKNFKSDIIYLLEFGKLTKNRKNIIQNILNVLNNPPHSLKDNPEWIADAEYSALGCSLTCSKVDMYDISMTNISCKDLKNSNMFDNVILGGEVEYANVTKTKTGQNPGQEMCFVSLSDSTGVAESIIFFPEQYQKYKNILFTGNVIIVKGKRTKNNKEGLVVEKAYIAKT